MTLRLRVGALYFAIVFATGFVLGSVRVPLLVPRWGERMAELAEMPLMFVATVLAAGFVVRRFGARLGRKDFVVVGLLALAFLLAAELSLAVVLSGRSVAAYVASRDPVSGGVYVLMLVLFAVMPWWRARRALP